MYIVVFSYLSLKLVTTDMRHRQPRLYDFMVWAKLVMKIPALLMQLARKGLLHMYHGKTKSNLKASERVASQKRQRQDSNLRSETERHFECRALTNSATLSPK
jgi:hypothetical protein